MLRDTRLPPDVEALVDQYVKDDSRDEEFTASKTQLVRRDGESLSIVGVFLEQRALARVIRMVRAFPLLARRIDDLERQLADLQSPRERLAVASATIEHPQPL